MPIYDPNAIGCVWGIDVILPRNAQGQYAYGARPLQLALTLTCFPLTAKGALAGVGSNPVSTQNFSYSDYSHTGIARVDGYHVYIPLEQAQSLCMSGVEKRVTAIHIRFEPEVSIEEGTRRVADLWSRFKQKMAGQPNCRPPGHRVRAGLDAVSPGGHRPDGKGTGPAEPDVRPGRDHDRFHRLRRVSHDHHQQEEGYRRPQERGGLERRAC